MIDKRVTVGAAVMIAVLFGLCLSAGMATAASDRTAVDATPIGGSDFDQPRDSGAADNSTLGAESTGITTANTGDVPTKVVNVTYEDDSRNGINEIVPTDDGNYLLIGLAGEDSDGAVKKVTPHGSVLWERTYGDERAQTFWRGIQTASGDFVLSGWTETAASITGWGVKVDQDGDKLWEVEQGTSEGTFWDVEETTRGRYIFVGEYNSSEGDDDAAIVKTSSDGTIIWGFIGWYESKQNNQNFFAIERIEPDRFVLVGQEYIKDRDDENWDAWSVKMDSNGEFISGESYGHPVLDDWFTDVTVTDEGDPVYIGARNGAFNSDENEYDFYDAWVYYDGSDDEWSEEFGVDNLNDIKSVKTDGDRIVAAGSSTSEEGAERNRLAVEYDFDGNQNWQLSENKPGYQDIDAVVVSKNDTYLGGESESGENVLEGQLLKYTSDSNGNTDSQVQLTNVELSQDSISNNSESDRTLTFDALNVSSVVG